MSEIKYNNLYEGLLTLQRPDAEVPQTRMRDPQMTRDMVLKAVRYDAVARDWKRSRLKGLVDGNPPYVQRMLDEAGRSKDCNVNWRIAKYFLNLAKAMLYDIFSESETYATVVLSDESDRSVDMSQVATEQFDWLQRQDENWDFTNQQAQGQSVFYGCGPIHFEDCYDWRPYSMESKALLLPELARSNTNWWEWAGLVVEYTPDRLYAKIANPEIARQAGFVVPEVRKSIMNAHPLTRTGVMYQSWSWHQDVLKNNSFYYADQSKFIRTCHFFFREFPEKDEEEGKITECIIELDGLAQSESGQLEYLFWAPKRYSSWREVIHPMYWDHDLNGYHHSVNGLGLEMYSALEFLNRLYCRQADEAFAPKLFFKPTTPSDREKMFPTSYGQWAILPAALDLVQQHVQPMLQDGIAMSREIQQIVSSNLSQFRSSALTKQQGNPVTARQIDYEASEQAKMGKTQLNRIYEQYDWLYAEKYRRATSPKLTTSMKGGKLAAEFVDRCKRRGVPPDVLRRVESVRATRITGQGSAYLRQQALEFLLGLMATLPEAGRTKLIRDVIAARAGQSHVNRYFPQQREDTAMLAQQSDAMQQVAGMKTGTPPVLVPTQNPMIYATTFLQAAEGAMQAIQQGAEPHEGLAFLNLAIPAIAGHAQRMAPDKSRQQEVGQIEDRLRELTSFRDEVTGQLQKQQQDQQQAAMQMQAIQAGTDPETQVGLAKVQAGHQRDMMKLQGNLDIKARKEAAALGMKAQRQRVEMALKDATTAHDMRLKRASAANNGRNGSK